MTHCQTDQSICTSAISEQRAAGEDCLTCRYNNLDELYHSKSEEGLSRLLAFLRDEEERERLEQIERMKPIGTQVLPLPPNLPCTSEFASRGFLWAAEAMPQLPHPYHTFHPLAALHANMENPHQQGSSVRHNYHPQLLL